jgi:hypothetical protein
MERIAPTRSSSAPPPRISEDDTDRTTSEGLVSLATPRDDNDGARRSTPTTTSGTGAGSFGSATSVEQEESHDPSARSQPTSRGDTPLPYWWTDSADARSSWSTAQTTHYDVSLSATASGTKPDDGVPISRAVGVSAISDAIDLERGGRFPPDLLLHPSEAIVNCGNDTFVDLAPHNETNKRKVLHSAPSVSFADVPDVLLSYGDDTTAYTSTPSASVNSPVLVQSMPDPAYDVGQRQPQRYSSTSAEAVSTSSSIKLPPRHSGSLHSPPGSGANSGGYSAISVGNGALPTSVSNPSISNTSGSSSSRFRIYKSSNSGTTKWVTREIAALDFLLGIPMEAEQTIVNQGWMQQQGILIHPPASSKKRRSRDGEDTKTEEVPEPPTDGVLALTPFSSNIPHSTTHHGRWWEKWISHPAGSRDFKSQYSQHTEQDGEELEQPNISQSSSTRDHQQLDPELLSTMAHMPQPTLLHAPGRRLDGDQACLIQIPLNVDTIVTRQRSIARLASIREWELRVAHGIGSSSTGGQHMERGEASSSQTEASPTLEEQTEFERSSQKVQEQRSRHQLSRRSHQTPMLDGRMFFSASGSYPIGVYSLIRYNPKNEEAVRRRKKLEARGGGGTQFFIMPERDWRGISYSALLPSYNDHNDDTNAVRSKRRRRRRLRTKKDRDSSTPGGISTDALSPDPTVFDRFATSTHRSHSTTNLTTTSTSMNSKAIPDGELDDDDDELSVASTSSDEDDPDDTYAVGLLDDPEMVQGRHRNVMIGDRVTGCIVSSTIQFVKPSILKADLNKKFRDRFDGWEPPKSQHKYIGARVVDGLYTLIEPGGAGKDDSGGGKGGKDSTSSRIDEADGQETIRMPPSLTLSKIRSIKRQALEAAVKAKLELSTVALAFVYFERLCLDCRVDKTNRRLSFAACLLLAIKINESHVGLVMKKQEESSNDNGNISPKDKSAAMRTTTRLQSLIRPTKKSSNMFASLLEFFTQDWSLSLKHLFAAEWGVFAALQFRLHARPSHVAFHFRRLIKSMGWDPLLYLGTEMFGYWQQSLALEEYQRIDRAKRQKIRQQRKEEEKLIHLKRELDAAKRRELATSNRSGMSGEKKKNSKHRDDDGSISRLLIRRTSSGITSSRPSVTMPTMFADQHTVSSPNRSHKSTSTRLGTGMNFLLGFGVKRAISADKLDQQHQQISGENRNDHRNSDHAPLIRTSPSMPAIAGSFRICNENDLILDVIAVTTNVVGSGEGVHGSSIDSAVATDGNFDEWGDEEGGIMI